jgi:hypothetical protein
MAESLDDKLARAFANIDVKLDAIDKKLGNQYAATQDLIRRVGAIERILQSSPQKPPKT